MADRLTLILQSLHSVLSAFARWRPQPYVVWLGTQCYVAPADTGPLPPIAPETWALLRDRAGRAFARLAGLFARWQAGTLPAPRYDFPRPRRARGTRTARAYARLPRGRAWVAGRIFDIRGYASQLGALLAEPEFQPFLAAAPQAGRLLRPLCHMLGTALPPCLVPPPRPRTPRPPRPPKPRRPSLNDPGLKWRGWELRAARASLKKYGRDR